MKPYLLIITVLSDAQLNGYHGYFDNEIFPEIHVDRYETEDEMLDEIYIHKENLGERLKIDFCGKIDYEINTDEL